MAIHTLFHTSPSPITKITDDGLFDEFLFFSCNVYAMGPVACTYAIELDDNDCIAPSQFFYDDECELLTSGDVEYTVLTPILDEIMEATGVDAKQAERFLEGKDCEELHDIDNEYGWQIQRLQGKAAKILGYRAAVTEDEQGTVWIVDMLGREDELQIVEDWSQY